MITFSRLEKKGNLGNQLFQIASTIGIAKSNNQDFAFPKWRYSEYFVKSLPVTPEISFATFPEHQFHYEPVYFDSGNYDLDGWFQSEKYFDIPMAKEYLTFKPEFLAGLKAKYAEAFSKKTILFSIRRGDFVDHPDYLQLPVNHYINAMITHFPDWKSRNLVVLSDDIAYCKFHFSFLPNAFFGDSLSGIEQLALASLCDDFIISNSTFSWWCAWLGEKKDSIVICPTHNFSESKLAIDNDADYYPERWTHFSSSDNKIDVGDVSIVVKDADELISEYYISNFKMQAFSKTDVPNDNERTIFIANCIVPPLCVYDAAKAASKTTAFLKGKFIRVAGSDDFPILSRQFDFGIFTKIMTIENSAKTDKLLFICTSNSQDDNSGLNANEVSNKVYSYAGKSGALFSRYQIKVKKESAIRQIKRSIKKLLNIKKK